MKIKHCILISLIIMLLLMIPASFAAADDSIILDNNEINYQTSMELNEISSDSNDETIHSIEIDENEAIPRIKATSTQTIQTTST